MALNTQTEITIGGKNGGTFSLPFERLEIHETLYGHHRFEMALATELLVAGAGNDMFDKVNTLVGEKIYIIISPKKGVSALRENELRFTGIITRITAGKSGDSDQSVCLVKGSGCTILLEDLPDMATYSGLSLSKIAEDVLKNYPANDLNRQISPRFAARLPYVVRYKENSWQFLQRLFARHGEWFYYDGEKLCIGELGQAQPAELTYGVNLTSFDYRLNAHPRSIKLTANDYLLAAQAEAASPSDEPGMLNSFTGYLSQKSASLFHNQAMYKINQYLGENAPYELKRLQEHFNKGRLSELATLIGSSESLHCRVGSDAEIKETLPSSRDHGRFIITSVSHYCTGGGNYTNRFEAVPADAAAPYADLERHPLAEAQSAVVIDNHDPENMGRVRVQFHWQQGMTPWLRMLSPAGGEGKGFYMIPEIGEEVWVDFEGGNPELPYVAGAAWNGRARGGFGTEKNDIKAIRTRSGHTIELNDAYGKESITIHDKSGNTIRMDTSKGSITITAPEDMTLNAKNMNINIQEDLSIKVGGNKTERVREKHNLQAKNSSTVITENLSMRSGKKTNQVAGELIVRTNDGDMVLDGKGKVILQSKDRVDYGG